MKRVLVGKFKLEDPKGMLGVSNVYGESERTVINGYADSGIRLIWEKDGEYANVYYKKGHSLQRWD
ncbi:MAG: hypothetical protein HYW24_02240 [Candidatus Aenigmarchaeota archaeon]|nr:hypothetical protein [Candidatus Aenigmarchaeota archaeon]